MLNKIFSNIRNNKCTYNIFNSARLNVKEYQINFYVIQIKKNKFELYFLKKLLFDKSRLLYIELF